MASNATQAGILPFEQEINQVRKLSPFNLRGNVASQLARDSNNNVSDNTLWYRGRNDTSSLERSKSPKASDIIRRKYSQGRTVSSNVN